MAAVAPVVGVEIGTSKTVAVVGELREDGHVMITGMGEQRSVGVRKGEVIDLENAVSCLRGVLDVAEESGRVTINEILLSVTGGHIVTTPNSGTVPVIDPDEGIGEEDIEQVMEVARAVNLTPDRQVLHTICQYFCIDDHARVIRPEGLAGARLSLDMLIVHGSRSCLNNVMRVPAALPVDVQDTVFAGLCAALAVLTPEQKKSGVLVIDLGGGTTDYLAYADSFVAAAGCIGVGGDHVTNDIMAAFSIPAAKAEMLKRENGCALVRTADDRQRVAVPPEVGFQGRSISIQGLEQVMHARMEETLGMIQTRIVAAGIQHRLGAGVVLTGGGAHMPGVVELVESIFNVPCSIGRPRNVSGLTTAREGPEYATACGLVQYGFRTAQRQRAAGLGGFLRSIFGSG